MATQLAMHYAEIDKVRLKTQLQVIREFLLTRYNVTTGQCWFTLAEIAEVTGYPQASISAQLRHLRKPQYGGYVVEKRPRGDREHGWWEYRVQKGSE
jgi:hypothetical protein